MSPVMAWSIGRKIQNKTIPREMARALAAGADTCKGRKKTLIGTARHKRTVATFLAPNSSQWMDSRSSGWATRGADCSAISDFMFSGLTVRWRALIVHRLEAIKASFLPRFNCADNAAFLR